MKYLIALLFFVTSAQADVYELTATIKPFEGTNDPSPINKVKIRFETDYFVNSNAEWEAVVGSYKEKSWANPVSFNIDNLLIINKYSLVMIRDWFAPNHNQDMLQIYTTYTDKIGSPHQFSITIAGAGLLEQAYEQSNLKAITVDNLSDFSSVYHFDTRFDKSHVTRYSLETITYKKVQE